MRGACVSKKALALLRLGRLLRAAGAAVPACSCELPWPRCPDREPLPHLRTVGKRAPANDTCLLPMSPPPSPGPVPPGSNVAALQTEAVLDVLTDEWVVHTPDEGAIKWWIGNAAEDGRAATVFARWAANARRSSATICNGKNCVADVARFGDF